MTELALNVNFKKNNIADKMKNFWEFIPFILEIHLVYNSYPPTQLISEDFTDLSLRDTIFTLSAIPLFR